MIIGTILLCIAIVLVICVMVGHVLKVRSLRLGIEVVVGPPKLLVWAKWCLFPVFFLLFLWLVGRGFSISREGITALEDGAEVKVAIDYLNSTLNYFFMALLEFLATLITFKWFIDNLGARKKE